MKATIEVYTFCFRKKRRSLKLNFSKGIDVFDLFKNNFIRYIQDSKTGDVPAEKRTVRIPKARNSTPFWGSDDKKRCIYGIIETGLYGHVLEIVQKDNPEDILKTYDSNCAVMKPFFFLISLPHNGDIGYIILERTDNDGILPLLRGIMIGFMDLYYPLDEGDSVVIDQHNYLSKEYVSSLKNGVLKSVSFNLRQLPKDSADRYMMREWKEDVSISLKINFKGGLFSDHKVARAILDENTIFTSPVLKDLFDNSTKSIVTLSDCGGGKKERTIYLDSKNQSMIRPYYIVDVATDSRGYSDFSSIKNAVFGFIEHNADLSKIK